MDSFDETYSKKSNRKNKNKSKIDGKKADWLVRISAAQLSLAAAAVAVLLLIMQLAPASFNALKAEFERIMQTDMSIKQVVSLIRSAVTTEEHSPEEASAAGGEDITVYESTDNVCFAPLDVTAQFSVPVSGRISSHFGYRKHPVTGSFGIHSGTDIAAQEGAAISAALNGTVKEVGYNSIRGNYILLSHGGKTETLYMHCSEIIAAQGANVRSGEIIARVGSTGRSTGPHLHFTITVDGKYCNPEWLINDY